MFFATGLAIFPVTGTPIEIANRDITLADGTILTIGTDGPISDKRDFEEPKVNIPRTVVTSDGMVVTISDTLIENSLIEERDSLQKRNTDYVSSCGPISGWIPIQDHASANGILWWGFNSTINAFCNSMAYDQDGNPIIVPAGKYASTVRRFELESSQSGSRVALKNEVPGHITCKLASILVTIYAYTKTSAVEIHNKQKDAEHRVDANSCVQYLTALTNPTANGKNCYGSKNDDTKGGTWQVGADAVSYHAFPASN